MARREGAGSGKNKTSLSVSTANEQQHADDHPLSPSILFEGEGGAHDDSLFDAPGNEQKKKTGYFALPVHSSSSSSTAAAAASSLVLDDAPHRLQRSKLSQLPVETLVSLVQTLSTLLDAEREQRAGAESDARALESVLLDKGVSQGELDRAKLRARSTTDSPKPAAAPKEWKIALSLQQPASLDLQDLADAISDDNAFATTAATVENDSHSITSIEAEDKLLPGQKAAKQTRARHASLSSRILGSFSLSPPPSTATPTTRSSRSDSIRSNNTDTSEAARSYTDWKGWRTWGRSSKQQPPPSEDESMTGLQEDDVQTPLPPDLPTPLVSDLTAAPHANARTASRSSSRDRLSETPTKPRHRASSVASSASLSPFGISAQRNSSPARKTPSLLQIASPESASIKSPATLSFASSSTGTEDVVDDRPAHLAALASSTPSISTTLESATMTPSTSQSQGTATVDSSAKATLGKALGLGSSASMSRSSSASQRRPSSTTEPNLTLFPPKLGLGKYTFAATAVSMPTTTAEIVQNGPSMPTTAPLKSTNEKKAKASTVKNSSLELDSIPSSSAPPTLTSPLASLPPLDDASEGPLVDRYGFVYDLKSSMKLLREARRRRERKKRGEGSSAFASATANDADDDVQEAAAALLEAPMPSTSASAEEELEELKLALGIASSNHESPNLSRLSSPSMPASAPTPPRLVRSKSSDSSPLSVGSSTKRLLAQLTDMQEANEAVSKERWEAFMQRRRKRLPPTSISATASASSSTSPANDHEWSENLIGIAHLGVDKKGKGDWREFKKLVRSGVPMAYRPKIWAECSGANEAREPGVYQELLETHRGKTNQCLTQIDMDCHRTFPTNVFFAGNGPGVAKLRNVLVAYSWRNPTIGYCQGMNNLTAMLLLIYTSEEDAFWVLVCMIENILPQDYYTSQLLVSQADQRVLSSLMQKLYPTLYDKMDELGVELPALTFGWFLSLFTDALPVQTLLRVWDLLFVFGTVMLFRVALAIFALHEKELVECDSASTFYSLVKGITAHLYQVEPLLKIACEDLRNSVKEKEVSRLREQFVEEMLQSQA